ncbi:DUF1102 domain-containing protein [Halovivax gelatinilyticus]|uniref:DUF1102 domain-containing protein n=1 Tax=Halovivax gelatinilyticus TaxID=2961597 RepID=UPI0020CA75B0|nr:DUF1102 domain-containing protein [Halovivax gelatinilyticus]
MQRRNFLVGIGGTAIGASALVGSGAFSRVESDRAVNIEVAPDDEAYLGLVPLDNANSNNYVELDDNGHLEIDIADQPIGDGVNSNSRTEFEGMFDICNNGKDTATITVDVTDLEFHPSASDGINSAGTPVADVQDEDGNSIVLDSDDDWEAPGFEPLVLETGECETMRIVTETYGIDATEDEPLISGRVTIVADAPGAGGN